MAVSIVPSQSSNLPNNWKSPETPARQAYRSVTPKAALNGASLLITTFFKTAGALMLQEDLVSNYHETLNNMD